MSIPSVAALRFRCASLPLAVVLSLSRSVVLKVLPAQSRLPMMRLISVVLPAASLPTNTSRIRLVSLRPCVSEYKKRSSLLGLPR